MTLRYGGESKSDGVGVGLIFFVLILIFFEKMVSSSHFQSGRCCNKGKSMQGGGVAMTVLLDCIAVASRPQTLCSSTAPGVGARATRYL